MAISFLWMDRYREQGRQRIDSSQSILADLRGGASFAIGEPVVRWSLLLILAAAMFGMATFSTLAPIYATDELGLGADGYGAFLGAAGAGALVAALLVTTFAHGDRRPWLSVGVLGMAALVAGLAMATSVTVVFGLAFLLGAAQITLAQNALVSVHSATPDALRGRVMGLWVTCFQGSSLFGSILAGLAGRCLRRSAGDALCRDRSGRSSGSWPWWPSVAPAGGWPPWVLPASEAQTNATSRPDIG